MDGDRARLLDSYLIASARMGDRRALGMMAERWQPRLLVHAWRLLGDREQARDAVQDAWAEIMAGLGRLRDDMAFAAWAYRIVSRRCARSIRRVQGERLLASALADVPADDAPDSDRSRAMIAARRALHALPAGQQAAVALFYFEDLSVAEIAVALDVPAGTVKTRLMHARRTLRAALLGDE